jgi:hypothetical protein
MREWPGGARSALREEIRKDAIEPCLVIGAGAIEQRRQGAESFGRDGPSRIGIAEAFVLAHQNGDGVWVAARRSLVARRVRLTAELRRRRCHMFLRREMIEHRLM